MENHVRALHRHRLLRKGFAAAETYRYRDLRVARRRAPRTQAAGQASWSREGTYRFLANRLEEQRAGRRER